MWWCWNLEWGIYALSFSNGQLASYLRRLVILAVDAHRPQGISPPRNDAIAHAQLTSVALLAKRFDLYPGKDK